MSRKLLIDESKTPYENVLNHAGFSVDRNKDEGTLTLKPNTSFKTAFIRGDWDFEPELGHFEVRMSISNVSKSIEDQTFVMTKSFHNKHSVDLPSASQASDWHAYENEKVRMIASEGDQITIKVWVDVNQGKRLYTVLDGSFVMPPKEKYDFVGSSGVFLVDPDGCLWTVFLDAVDIVYANDASQTPRTTLVSLGLHARLEF